MLPPWLAWTTLVPPPADRIQFFGARACAPSRCLRCGGLLRAVPDGMACLGCPWHAVVQEMVAASIRHGYMEAKPYYELDALDDREGLSTKAFFRARSRFCAS